jgi:hypothetical protein
MTRITTRAARQAATFLLLGGVLSIAIANVCGLWSPVREGYYAIRVVANRLQIPSSDKSAVCTRVPGQWHSIRLSPQPLPMIESHTSSDRIDAGIGYVPIPSRTAWDGSALTSHSEGMTRGKPVGHGDA